jgi:hypothetical protein
MAPIELMQINSKNDVEQVLLQPQQKTQLENADTIPKNIEQRCAKFDFGQHAQSKSRITSG